MIRRLPRSTLFPYTTLFRPGPPVPDEFAGGGYHQSAEPDDDIDLAPDDGGRGQAEPAPVGDVAGDPTPGHDGDRGDRDGGREGGQPMSRPVPADGHDGQEQGRHGQDPVVGPGNGRDEKVGDGAEGEPAGLVPPPVGPHGQDEAGHPDDEDSLSEPGSPPNNPLSRDLGGAAAHQPDGRRDQDGGQREQPAALDELEVPEPA